MIINIRWSSTKWPLEVDSNRLFLGLVRHLDQNSATNFDKHKLAATIIHKQWKYLPHERFRSKFKIFLEIKKN